MRTAIGYAAVALLSVGLVVTTYIVLRELVRSALEGEREAMFVLFLLGATGLLYAAIWGFTG